MAYNVGESLNQIAKNKGEEPHEFFKRFAMSQYMFRVTEADHAGDVMMIGGMAWVFLQELKADARNTTDMDIRFTHVKTEAEVRDIFENAAKIERDDGMRYEITKYEDLNHSGDHKGMRVRMIARCGEGRSERRAGVHIDVGFGYGAKPRHAKVADFPSLHPKLESGKIQIVPVEYIAAEKMSAILVHGMDNTRLKDFNDLYVLASKRLDPARMAEAVALTFSERRHDIPADTCDLEGLSMAFVKKNQEAWERWLVNFRRTEKMPGSFAEVVARVDEFMMTSFRAAAGFRHDVELELDEVVYAPRRPA
jgi:hypothetical protein